MPFGSSFQLITSTLFLFLLCLTAKRRTILSNLESGNRVAKITGNSTSPEPYLSTARAANLDSYYDFLLPLVCHQSLRVMIASQHIAQLAVQRRRPMQSSPLE